MPAGQGIGASLGLLKVLWRQQHAFVPLNSLGDGRECVGHIWSISIF
jgi:hypothetical protein